MLQNVDSIFCSLGTYMKENFPYALSYLEKVDQDRFLIEKNNE